jgi:preprotein translocase subunit SecA
MMLDAIKRVVTQVLMTVQVRSESDIEAVEAPHMPENVQYHHADYDEALAASAENPSTEEEHKPFVRDGQKVGRNDPCPCGSGKKYKQCHGKLS